MAEVWEATDQILTRRVAVKLLHGHLVRDDSFVRRFRAEAIAAARLAHPSIVSVYDTFTDAGLEAIVMELVVGTTLRADLDQHGPLRFDALLAIGTQVADALGAAHASGLVHRDVKPANILLSADGRVLVADFGIAKAAEGSDLTSDGSVVGTAKYLAPEQVEGAALDGRADLYSLGVVLYEAITGEAPFVAETDTGTALARLHRDATPPSRLRPDLPASVEAVVMQAMARHRDQRFPDAAAMRAALLRAGADPRRAPAVAQAAVAASARDDRIPPAPPPSAPPAPRSSPRSSGTQPGPPRAAHGPGRRHRRWPWVLVVLGLLSVGVALAAVAVRDPTSLDQLEVTSAAAFDPFGDGLKTENNDLAALAVDGDPATSWQTEPYKNPNLAEGKGGVGLVVDLVEPATAKRIQVTSTDTGWSGAIYASTGPRPTDLSGWGDPIGSVRQAASGTTVIDLRGPARPEALLIWFTRLGEGGYVHVGDVKVLGQR